MRILVTAGRGKTGQRVISAMQRSAPDLTIRALSRKPVPMENIETIIGDMDDAAVRARAVASMDVVIHYAPPMHPRETAMGTGMIDAAVAAGVRRFVFISVIHPEIDDLLNHQAKLRVEAHLINSGIPWTVLRPQHYFQNIDVRHVAEQGRLIFPYPVETRLGHVDMNDLADAVALVATRGGHDYATYDIASNEHLSVDDLAATIGRLTGKAIAPIAISPADLVDRIAAMHPLTAYSQEAFHRLFGYYARRGIQGNANVLGWLLQRPASSFEAYVRRCLDGSEGPVGNAG